MDNEIAIIPARYASTRLPGKPLADMLGKPMICRVVERALEAVGRVVVATDDERIFRVVTDFGGEAVMTSESCRSGTDRCCEAYDLCNHGEEIVINLQGDEPFIAPESIRSLVAAFAHDTTTDIATLSRLVGKDCTYEELSDPNKPNVITDNRGYAIYFSRSVIPYMRGEDQARWAALFPYRKHIGVYAFRSSVLRAVSKLAPSTLELAESLEQLRWIQAGYSIRVVDTTHASVGIDTPEDLERAIQMLRDGSHH